VKSSLGSCPVCDEPFEQAQAVAYPSTAGAPASCPQEILVCPRCELGVANPMLTEDELGRLYEGQQYWDSDETRAVTPRQRPLPFALARARWEMIRSELDSRGKRRVSVLDIGAGPGYLGLTIARVSPDRLAVYGAVEPDPMVVHQLENGWRDLAPAARLRVRESLDQTGTLWDVVVLSHVLEHVIDPAEFLAAAARPLAPDGILMIDVPHADYRHKTDAFPHLHFFNQGNLDLLIRKVGLVPVSSGLWGRTGSWAPMVGDRSARAFRAARFITGIADRAVSLAWPARLPDLYGWFYGAAHRSADGPWLRVIATRPSAADPECRP
jgi:SAM-dependent methyltransferase